MPSGPTLLRLRRASILVLLVVPVLAVTAACQGGSGIVKQYEYEEEIYLSVDGHATVYVNTSIPALVSLRGVDLNTDFNARLERTEIRRLYTAPAARVVRVSTWRRLGRRFVQVRLEVDDITKLGTAPLFAWSDYRIDRKDNLLIYRQQVGSPAGRDAGKVGWNGSELVAFRLHVPSRVHYHNAGADNLKRGNILVWEQTLGERQAGKPLPIEARMETTSILYSTLMLFAASGALALTVLALIIWRVVRKGRQRDRTA